MPGDVRDPNTLARAADGVDTVFHLASDFRSPTTDEDSSYAVNVTGTINVLEASLRAGVQRFVHCSTIGIHGSQQTVPGDETSPIAPGEIAYERHKAMAEESVREAAVEGRMTTTIIRPGGIYGPGDFRLLKLFRMLANDRFVMIGDGSVFIDMAYVSDVARGMVLAGTRRAARGEAFIVSGGEYVPVGDFVRLIADELGTKGVRMQVPLEPVVLAARLAEAMARPFGVTPPLTVRRLGFFTSNRAFSIAKAREILGFEPQVSLREGVRRTICWYRQNDHLPQGS